MTETMTQPDHRTSEDIPEHLRERFIDELLAGRVERCGATTQASLDAGAEPWRIYQDLFRPALYRVGELWAMNRISVAKEHLATALVEQLMIDLYPQFPEHARQPRKVVLATVEDELHRIGLRMIADCFDALGWEALITESGCGTTELMETIDQEQPDLLGLSCSVAFHLPTLEHMLDQVQGRFPRLPILVGGQAFVAAEVDALAERPRVTLIRDLAALNAWISAFDQSPTASERDAAGPSPGLPTSAIAAR
jgi:methanogenic corrinoid protein MtbC1